MTALAEIMALASGVKTTESINSEINTWQMLSDSQHWDTFAEFQEILVNIKIAEKPTV